MRTPPWSRGSAALLVIALLSACGGGSEPTTAGSTATSSGTGLATYRAALDGYSYLQRAEGELIRRCMDRIGYPYWPQTSAPKSASPTTFTVAAAKESGYASFVPATPTQDRQSDYYDALTETERLKYDTALIGGSHDKTEITSPQGTLKVPTGGCQTEAEKSLYPQREKWIQLHTLVTNLSSAQENYSDPALDAKTQAWAGCMRQRGQTFASPGAAIEAAFERAGIAGPTAPAAKEIAIADATCRESSGYQVTARKAEDERMARLAATHESEILAYREIQQAAMARAAEVLGG